MLPEARSCLWTQLNTYVCTVLEHAPPQSLFASSRCHQPNMKATHRYLRSRVSHDSTLRQQQSASIDRRGYRSPATNNLSRVTSQPRSSVLGGVSHPTVFCFAWRPPTAEQSCGDLRSARGGTSPTTCSDRRAVSWLSRCSSDDRFLRIKCRPLAPCFLQTAP
jgi:hypothetical protein